MRQKPDIGVTLQASSLRRTVVRLIPRPLQALISGL